MKKANLLIDCQDHLGEGVLWSKTDQKLYWLDVPMPSKLHQLHIPTNNHDTFDMPEMITAMSVRPNGDLLIATQKGVSKELTDLNLLLTLISHPLMGIKVILAIHWHALRLFLKGIRFHSYSEWVSSKYRLNKRG